MLPLLLCRRTGEKIATGIKETARLCACRLGFVLPKLYCPTGARPAELHLIQLHASPLFLRSPLPIPSVHRRPQHVSYPLSIATAATSPAPPVSHGSINSTAPTPSW